MEKDLRSYIAYLENNLPGELMRVKKPVDPSWEVSAFVRALQAQGRFPAVLFENVKGYDMPIITNLFASRERLASTFETTWDKTLAEYAKREDNLLKPRLVDRGPVKEVIKIGEDADVSRLPIVTHAEKDDGAYITPGVAIVKDPDTGVYNAGIYRMSYKDPHRLTICIETVTHAGHIMRKVHKRGQPLEVVLALGHHPAMYHGSQSRVSIDVDELEVMGGLLGEPLDVVKCETVDLVVPADCEIAIEGRILPDVHDSDGPFGEFTWYMGAAIPATVFQVTAITHRKDAIFHDLHSPYIDHNYCGRLGKEVVLYKRVKQVCPTLREVNLTESGCCRFVAYVQITKEFDGQGKNVALAALNSDPFLKIAIVVDDDVDIQNEREVIWAVATRTQPDQDFFFVPEAYVCELIPTGHTVRSRTERGYLDTKVGIDATRPVGVPFAERTEVRKEDWVNMKIEDYL